MMTWLLLMIMMKSFAGPREAWVIGPGAAARAVASELSTRVISRSCDDTVFAAITARPAYVIHQGPVVDAQARRLKLTARAAGARLINVGDPGTRRGWFDLILSPRFEPPLAGANVLRLDEWPSAVASDPFDAKPHPSPPGALPSPVLMVLLAGPVAGRTFTADHARRCGETTRALARARGGSVVVFAESHVTEPARRALISTLTGVPAYVVAVGEVDAAREFLALADYIVVAGGSADNLAAARATGKPILFTAPTTSVDESYKRFLLSAIDSGAAHPLTEASDLSWRAPPARPVTMAQVSESSTRLRRPIS